MYHCSFGIGGDFPTVDTPQGWWCQGWNPLGEREHSQTAVGCWGRMLMTFPSALLPRWLTTTMTVLISEYSRNWSTAKKLWLPLWGSLGVCSVTFCILRLVFCPCRCFSTVLDYQGIRILCHQDLVWRQVCIRRRNYNVALTYLSVCSLPLIVSCCFHWIVRCVWTALIPQPVRKLSPLDGSTWHRVGTWTFLEWEEIQLKSIQLDTVGE